MDLNKLVRKNIQQMKPYSSARDEYKDLQTDMVFLDANENPFDSSLNRYPDPQQTALKAIISKQKEVAVRSNSFGEWQRRSLGFNFQSVL